MDEKVGLEINDKDDATVVSFRATSISNTEAITDASKQINEFIEDNHPGRIVFDFGSVKFFCSQVLGMLLDIRAKLKAYNGEVVISAIDPQLYRVFKITNLNEVFKFYPDKESAIKSFGTN